MSKRRAGFTPLEKLYSGRGKDSKQGKSSTEEYSVRKNSLTGFTLVEIMIVIGIIGLILTMAIPNFINARTKARAKVCVNNLHQIHGAKQQWALDTDAAETAEPVSANLAPFYLQKWPTCPAAGTYTIGAVNVLPTCSKDTGDSDYTWDDHVF